MQNNRAPTKEALPPSLVSRWLDVQSQDLTLRAESLQIQKADLDHQHEIAKQSISAQLQDRPHERTHNKAMALVATVFGGFVLVTVLVFGWAMAHEGKDALLSQIMAALIDFAKFLVGGITGYCIALAKGRHKDNGGTGDSAT